MTSLITEKTLKEKTISIFKANGVRQEEAEIVADVLVHANLRGVDSHGVLRVEHYIKRVQQGGLHIAAHPSMEQTTSSTATYDGDNGFGHVISKRAMEHATEMARGQGVGVVAVKNSSHCGALSYFVNQAAEKGMIGVAMAQTDKVVVPFGGAEPFFGTNPIAFGFPAKEEKPVILDLATSNVALGKILNAREYGKDIPPGWGVDAKGQTTTDPNDVSSLSPFGGAKGYGLAMVVEIFSALLTGSAFGPHVSKMYGDYNRNRELGQFYMIVNPEKFTMASTFLENIDRMVREIRSVPPAPGFERVMVPGEPEALEEEKRKREGIPLPDGVWAYLSGE
ncbi:ureidoglycolate dehydrogenase [Shouchella shacheensis]|uniref:ureidoglycolate dehydrogenase n=1 Tax=Shouchella shacheensis TaxID=1649580 RepID=UPI00073FEEF5|nr:ureidoglycolate dehydrogenase [Shouchella shacheensis]